MLAGVLRCGLARLQAWPAAMARPRDALGAARCRRVQAGRDGCCGASALQLGTSKASAASVAAARCAICGAKWRREPDTRGCGRQARRARAHRPACAAPRAGAPPPYRRSSLRSWPALQPKARTDAVDSARTAGLLTISSGRELLGAARRQPGEFALAAWLQRAVKRSDSDMSSVPELAWWTHQQHSAQCRMMTPVLRSGRVRAPTVEQAQR